MRAGAHRWHLPSTPHEDATRGLRVPVSRFLEALSNLPVAVIPLYLWHIILRKRQAVPTNIQKKRVKKIVALLTSFLTLQHVTIMTAAAISFSTLDEPVTMMMHTWLFPSVIGRSASTASKRSLGNQEESNLGQAALSG